MACEENILTHGTALLHTPALGKVVYRQFIGIVQGRHFECREDVLDATTETVAAGVHKPIHQIVTRTPTQG